MLKKVKRNIKIIKIWSQQVPEAHDRTAYGPKGSRRTGYETPDHDGTD